MLVQACVVAVGERGWSDDAYGSWVVGWTV